VSNKWVVTNWNDGVLIINDKTLRAAAQQIISFTTKDDAQFAKEIVVKLSEWLDKIGENN